MYEINNPKHQKILVDIIKKCRDKTQFDYWKRAGEELNKRFEENIDKETWRGRFRSLEEEYKIKMRSRVHSYDHNKDKEERLVAYLKKECTIEFLCEMLELEELELLGYIQKLEMNGTEVININNSFMIPKTLEVKENVLNVFTEDKEEIRIGVISDTHIGNKKQQETLLCQFYDECEKRGIDTVLHCGDITDGLSNRKEHIYELFLLGADEQAEYVIDRYPQRDGITTYFITGNHDSWHFKNGGIDIGKIISKSRPDMIYLGFQKARVVINGCKIDLFHPLDGSAYGKSYSGQRTLDYLSEREKPDVMLTGHHHKSVCFYDKGVRYCEVPCLCEKTSFIEGKRLENTIGVMFITIKINKLGKVVSFIEETTIHEKTYANDFTLPNKQDKIRELII